MTSFRSFILILADGARYDVLEQLLESGRLPNIREHITDRGSYSRMTTVFTSTTGPAYLPFLTGCFPGTADVPGIRWFDKRAFVEKYFWHPHRFRSYCGQESVFMNRDIRPDVRTIFELAGNAINVFGPITKGIARGHNRGAWRKAWMISRAHATGRYEPLDESGIRLLLHALDKPSPFYFLALPGIDGISHNTHPRHERTIAAYEKVDEAVGRVAGRLRQNGRYEETVLALCSDHGLSPTHTHFDVPVYMEEELGIKTLYYTNVWRKNPEASAHVSGNGMIHIYFKNGDWRRPCRREDVLRIRPGLLDTFVKHPSVDLALSRMDHGWIHVDSRQGTARVREAAGLIEYQGLSGDPLGLGRLPEKMSFEEALDATWESEYPDGLVQIVQIFRSRRCGDLLLSAEPGHDLRKKWESPEHKSSHGSLRRDHMMTPFGISLPIARSRVRSVDVFPSILSCLGKSIPEGIDGRTFVGEP